MNRAIQTTAINTMRMFKALCMVLFIFGGVGIAHAANERFSLQDIGYEQSPDGSLQVKLVLSGLVSDIVPSARFMDNPARLLIELPETGLELRNQAVSINSPIAKNVLAVQAVGSTRVLINLTRKVSYEIQEKDNALFINLYEGVRPARATADTTPVAATSGSEVVLPPAATSAATLATTPPVPATTATAMVAPAALARGIELEEVNFSKLPGDRIQIRLIHNTDVEGVVPSNFATENPARIAIDLANTKLGMNKRVVPLSVGVARDIRLVESGGVTRVVVSLARMVPYNIRTEGKMILIELQSGGRQRSDEESGSSIARSLLPSAPSLAPMATVENIDFRRGIDGEGKIVVVLDDPDAVVDLKESGGKIIIDILNTKLPDELERRLDVTDFATPVISIDSYNHNGNTRLAISAAGEYEHLAYQAGDSYTIEVKPIIKAESDTRKREEGEFTGEKLSLNFQNIDVRAVLQLIAEFTGLNIVASDTVTGNITLRLKNVPWDQALDIILKTKGLGMRQSGNVILIAPNDEIAQRESLELEARKKVEELVPLKTDFFQINYAKASEIAALIKQKENSILSPRGNVTLDERTNTLMIMDTVEKLEEIGRLIKRLDVPVKQVLIESRIVIASDNFSKELGTRFGVTQISDNGASGIVTTSGSATGTDTTVSSALDSLASTGSAYPVEIGTIDDRLNVNLPTTSTSGSIALAILGADYLVDLELSAMQQEGGGEVISSPRVITSNQKEATIESGVEVPYQEASSSGATTVAFKKAVLGLSVTPQITPDDRVIMDLKVSKDSVGAIYNSIPTIDTRAVTTQVLVNNGDTVVLGGIYEQDSTKATNKVPFLGDLPLVGRLFRHTSQTNNKSELLIFVTPKILKDGLTTN